MTWTPPNLAVIKRGDEPWSSEDHAWWLLLVGTYGKAWTKIAGEMGVKMDRVRDHGKKCEGRPDYVRALATAAPPPRSLDAAAVLQARAREPRGTSEAWRVAPKL